MSYCSIPQPLTHFGAQFEKMKKSRAARTFAFMANPINYSTLNFTLSFLLSRFSLGKGSLQGVRTIVTSMKRSLKRAFRTVGYYGPEIGLCSCMIKYAWYNYPVVPEITYSAIGRAKRAFGGFVQDFMHGFQESQNQHYYSQQRISNNIADVSVDDYADYQSRVNIEKYNVLRRNDEIPQPQVQQQQQQLPQADPQVVLLADFLKHLKPKGVPAARSLNVTSQNATSEGRNFQPAAQRRVLVSGKPSGVPGFNELPPADCKLGFLKSPHVLNPEIFPSCRQLLEERRLSSRSRPAIGSEKALQARPVVARL
jgi:hypothetical protein